MIVNALIGTLAAGVLLLAAPTVINIAVYLKTAIDSIILLSRLPLKLALQETEQTGDDDQVYPPAIESDINRPCVVYTQINVVGDSVQVCLETEESEYTTKLYAVFTPDDADEFAEEIKENAKIARGN